MQVPVRRPAPDSSSLEEREPRSVFGSGVAATGYRVRTPGRCPKVVVEQWAPRALAALPAWRPSTAGGGLWVCGRGLDSVAMGSRVQNGEVQPRSPTLGPRCARRARPEELEACSVLGSGVAATSRGHRPQGEDAGPGPQGGRRVVGTRYACNLPCPAPLESPLGGAAPRPQGMDSGSADAAWALSLRARGSRTGRCHQGARNLGRLMCFGRGGSAGVKGSLLPECAQVVWAHSSGILFAGRR
ncbi:unnamed protein product [Rangifer tarandus platyrhynchus]|uniref:Uncharacterized protein n=1 Tax=Rangifer tarandus platyrhynchus TaxID=3082113 RepID=A0ABN8Z689_RANTA|nr:unnamed protein product [Rangifer tarandus platyrhynchus]